MTKPWLTAHHVREMAPRTVLLFVALAAFMCLPFACGGGRNLNAYLLGDDSSGFDDDDAAGGFGGGGRASGGDIGMGGRGGSGEGGRTGPGPSTGPGGIQDCLACAATNCPDAVACFTDPVCQAGIACAVGECLGGGDGPDIACFLECFEGDTEAAFEAFQALTCLFTNCQDECAALIGGGFPGGP